MLNKAKDDDLVMSLVDLALTHPPDQRESYLKSACGADTELFEETWSYVRWEERMNGFLLDPLYPAASYEHPFEPGELLDGRFRIVREIAQGGMGVVYEAVDEKLKRRIALKCAKTGFRKRLPPEVRNATEISHPNVCKIFEIHTTSTRQGDIDFITMEFLDGETLLDRLTRGPLPEKEARAIALQLCAGLGEAHRNQVIHGDLKSNNVILTSGPHGAVRAVITDFGLARGPEGAQTNAPSGQMAGTPDYMAPELWKGGKASVASDIYALGVILSQLGSGRQQNRILARCLNEDPASRFPNADAIAQALVPLRSRRWFLTAAAATILVSVITGVITYQRATAPQESVRLAMLPFSYSADLAPLGKDVLRGTSVNLVKLRGGTKARYSAVSLADIRRAGVDTPEKAKAALSATHILHGSLTKEKDQVVLHAILTDTRTGVDAKDWTMEYAPGQTRYIPIALAGFVTGTLHLPPLATEETVNAAAYQNYLSGLSSVRRDSGVDSALTFLEQAVAGDPDSPFTFAGLAEAQWFKYFLSKDRLWLDRATDSERQAELRNPDLAPVHRIAGVLLANAGRYELAEAEYRRAIELVPANGDAWRRLGQVLEQNNQTHDALAAYQRAVEVDPRMYRNYQALGTFYNKHANYTEAKRYFTETVELAPSEPAAHFALGATCLNAGQFSEAESEFRKALDLQTTPEALNSLGMALMYQSRETDAVPYFLEALRLQPERYLSWMYLAVCYRRLNRSAESQRANQRGFELAETEISKNPRSGYVRSFLAYLSASLGDHARAESEIKQALELSPNDTDTRWMAVLTYEALDQRRATLDLLSTSSAEFLADVSRWPDLAELHRDSRFQQLSPAIT